jgi:hypothetical protein
MVNELLFKWSWITYKGEKDYGVSIFVFVSLCCRNDMQEKKRHKS